MRIKPMMLTAMAALAFTVAATPAAKAAAPDVSTYPTKPIRMVVPFAPSGITDLLGRVLADELGKHYGESVVVENRAGASGHIGAQIVSNAAADGYTLLIGTIGIHAAYKAYSKLAYEPAKTLQPVTIIGESPNIVLVPQDSPFKTFQQFLKHEKDNPGRMNYATAGPGSSTHMVIALYEQMVDTKVTYVPYKGSGPALVDLIAGRVDVMFDNMPTGYPHVVSGKLRPLAITSRERSPIIPDVPTLAESGVPGYEGTSWFTVAVHADVPAALVEKINGDVRTVLSKKEVQAKLGDLGLTVIANSPADARQFFISETEKWTRVIESSGIQLD